MRKKDVLAFFGSQAETARRLGITRSAVQQWPDLIPERSAWRAQAESRGKLKVDPSVYRSDAA